MSEHTQKKSRELTGRHILLSVIAFFVVLFIVNGAFIYAAVTSFRGEDVERSYRQGLNYNQTLAARREQATLGWDVTVAVESNEAISSKASSQKISVRLTDAQGRELSDTKISGRLRHPIDTDLDVPLIFQPGNPAVSVFTVDGGRWSLEALAVKGDDRLAFRKEIVIE